MDASSQPGESNKTPLSRTDSQSDSQPQKSQTQERHLLQASTVGGTSTSTSSNSNNATATTESRTPTPPKQNSSPTNISMQDVSAAATLSSQSGNKSTSSTANVPVESNSAETNLTTDTATIPPKQENEPKSSVTLVSGRVNPTPTTASSSTTVTLSSSSTVGMKRPPSDILSVGQGGQQPSSTDHPDSDGSSGDPKRKKMRKENKNDGSDGNPSGISQSGLSSPVSGSSAGNTGGGSRNARGTGSSKQGKSSSAALSSKSNDKQNPTAPAVGTQGGIGNSESASASSAGSVHISGALLAGGGSTVSRDSTPMEVDQDKHSSSYLESSFSTSRVKPMDTLAVSSPAGNGGAGSGTAGSAAAPKVPPIKIVLQSHGHGSLNVGHGSGAASTSSGTSEPDGGSGAISNPSGFAYVVSSTTDNPAVTAPNSGSSPGNNVSSGNPTVPGNNSMTASSPDSALNVNTSSQPQPAPKNESSPGTSSSGPVTSTSLVTVTDASELGSATAVSIVSSTPATSVSSTSAPAATNSGNFSFSSSGTPSSAAAPHQPCGVDKPRSISPDNSSRSPNFGASSSTEKDKEKHIPSADKEKSRDSASGGSNLVTVKEEKSKDGSKGGAFQSSNGSGANIASGSSLSGSGPASNSSGSYSDDKEKEKPQRVTRSSQRMAHSSTTGSGNGHGGTGAPNSPSGANGSPKGSNCPSPNQQDNSQPAADNTAYNVKQEPSEKQDSGENSLVDIHPKKRKPKTKEIPNQSSSVSTASTEVCELPQNTSSNPAHEQPILNCFEMFLNIRKQIERRRKNLFPVTPKPPQGFKDYLMNRGTYVLASNANKSRLAVPILNPPPSLQAQMKEMFIEQEKERHKLRIQHLIEKEKLVLSVEQEILRVHGRAARALSNQALPFSVCTILKDQEVYNLLTPEQEEKDRNARSRYNGRLFLSWLQDVDDKWDKIKESMLLRHHNEAESLHAVQKMDWEWKLKEVGLCEPKAAPAIDDIQVPMVHVSDDFDLLPA